MRPAVDPAIHPSAHHHAVARHSRPEAVPAETSEQHVSAPLPHTLRAFPSPPTHACNLTRPRSDTDPGALADYIIALLKHEKPPTELKAFCISQLVDFLHDSTRCVAAVVVAII